MPETNPIHVVRLKLTPQESRYQTATIRADNRTTARRRCLVTGADPATILGRQRRVTTEILTTRPCGFCDAGDEWCPDCDGTGETFYYAQED